MMQIGNRMRRSKPENVRSCDLIETIHCLEERGDSVELRATLHAGPAAIAAHRSKHLAVEPASALEAHRHRDERAQLAAPDQGRCYRVRGGFQIPRHRNRAKQLLRTIGSTEQRDVLDLAVRLTRPNDPSKYVVRRFASLGFQRSHWRGLVLGQQFIGHTFVYSHDA